MTCMNMCPNCAQDSEAVQPPSEPQPGNEPSPTATDAIQYASSHPADDGFEKTDSVTENGQTEEKLRRKREADARRARRYRKRKLEQLFEPKGVPDCNGDNCIWKLPGHDCPCKRSPGPCKCQRYLYRTLIKEGEAVFGKIASAVIAGSLVDLAAMEATPRVIELRTRIAGLILGHEVQVETLALQQRRLTLAAGDQVPWEERLKNLVAASKPQIEGK